MPGKSITPVELNTRNLITVKAVNNHRNSDLQGLHQILNNYNRNNSFLYLDGTTKLFTIKLIDLIEKQQDQSFEFYLKIGSNNKNSATNNTTSAKTFKWTGTLSSTDINANDKQIEGNLSKLSLRSYNGLSKIYMENTTSDIIKVVYQPQFEDKDFTKLTAKTEAPDKKFLSVLSYVITNTDNIPENIG